MSKKLRLERWGWENVSFYIALHHLSALDNDYIPVMLFGISCNYDALSYVRWSFLSGLTLWRLRGSRSSLLMTLTGTTPGLVRNLDLPRLHLWALISRFCSSIRLPIFFPCSLDCKEDLPEARHWCGWIPENLRWPPEEWFLSAALLQEQRCHFTQHPAAVAENGHHWCWSQGVSQMLCALLYCLLIFPGCGDVLIVHFCCSLAVDGSLLPREGVIWTKWLEGLLLKLEQYHLLFEWCRVWWLRWLLYLQFWIRTCTTFFV